MPNRIHNDSTSALRFFGNFWGLPGLPPVLDPIPIGAVSQWSLSIVLNKIKCNNATHPSPFTINLRILESHFQEVGSFAVFGPATPESGLFGRGQEFQESETPWHLIDHILIN